jgi:hypothetical protein
LNPRNAKGRRVWDVQSRNRRKDRVREHVYHIADALLSSGSLRVLNKDDIDPFSGGKALCHVHGQKAGHAWREASHSDKRLVLSIRQSAEGECTFDSIFEYADIDNVTTSFQRITVEGG